MPKNCCFGGIGSVGTGFGLTGAGAAGFGGDDSLGGGDGAAPRDVGSVVAHAAARQQATRTASESRARNPALTETCA